MEGKVEIAKILLQIAIILVSAKLCGFFCSKFFKVPSLLGELLAGVMIAPYNFALLKGHIFQELFSPSSEYFAILKIIAEIGVCLLLFYSGLETDKEKFFKYFFTAFIIGAAGVIVPFVFCAAYIYYWLKLTGQVIALPGILFSGAIATATSVGITASVLSSFGKVDTVFGTAILVAAVIDDVLGLIVLSIVSSVGDKGIDFINIGKIAFRAIGIWVIIGIFFFLISYIGNKYLVKKLDSVLLFCLAVALAFFAGYICENVKLAAIVGTYVVGLSLSQTEWGKKIHTLTFHIVEFLLPFFFFKIGLLIQLSLFKDILISGIIFSILAVLGKFIGCGLFAYLLRISLKDSILVGIGMVPRGEVGLIIAFIALDKKVIPPSMYNIAVFMVFSTTVLAIVLLSTLIKKFYPASIQKNL